MVPREMTMMNEHGLPVNGERVEGAQPSDAVIVDFHQRRLQALQEAVDKTRAKMKKLERRLIRGELKKGRLRRKLLERTRALHEMETRLRGSENRESAGGSWPSSRHSS
jgi:hypothetical protein